MYIWVNEVKESACIVHGCASGKEFLGECEKAKDRGLGWDTHKKVIGECLATSAYP